MLAEFKEMSSTKKMPPVEILKVSIFAKLPVNFFQLFQAPLTLPTCAPFDQPLIVPLISEPYQLFSHRLSKENAPPPILVISPVPP
jgi:hypothetical protein